MPSTSTLPPSTIGPSPFKLDQAPNFTTTPPPPLLPPLCLTIRGAREVCMHNSTSPPARGGSGPDRCHFLNSTSPHRDVIYHTIPQAPPHCFVHHPCPTPSCPYHRQDRGSLLSMGPMWDYNEAFGICCGFPITVGRPIMVGRPIVAGRYYSMLGSPIPELDRPWHSGEPQRCWCH